MLKQAGNERGPRWPPKGAANMIRAFHSADKLVPLEIISDFQRCTTAQGASGFPRRSVLASTDTGD